VPFTPRGTRSSTRLSQGRSDSTAVPRPSPVEASRGPEHRKTDERDPLGVNSLHSAKAPPTQLTPAPLERKGHQQCETKKERCWNARTNAHICHCQWKVWLTDSYPKVQPRFEEAPLRAWCLLCRLLGCEANLGNPGLAHRLSCHLGHGAELVYFCFGLLNSQAVRYSEEGWLYSRLIIGPVSQEGKLKLR
jgi:hypothetical protein